MNTPLEWHAAQHELNAYLRGWGGYFRHGNRLQVLKKLDWYTRERVGRSLARCQPKGKKRKRRKWETFAEWVGQKNRLLSLSGRTGWQSNTYRGRANIRWKAV